MNKINFGYALIFVGLMATGCTGRGSGNGSDSNMQSPDSIEMVGNKMKFKPGNTVKTRYELPEGFHRVKTDEGTFEHYLQNLPLKPEGTVTHLYDGTEKEKRVATSVIDLDLDTLDIQHSAGAIIRLWAEYLFSTGQYEKIHFKFKNGFQCDYPKWAQGFRIRQTGGSTRWYKASDETDYSYPTFREYLRMVFRNTDSHSLAKEMKDATPEEFGIGTVFFNSKPPYNTAIVVDMLNTDDPTSYIYSFGDSMYGNAILLAQGGDNGSEIKILQGNGDDLNIFREDNKKKIHGYIWNTQLKGEYPMFVQGGRFWSFEGKFYNKSLKIFKYEK